MKVPGEVANLKAAVDHVMVRNRDGRHAELLEQAIELARFGEALRTAEFLHDPERRAFGVL